MSYLIAPDGTVRHVFPRVNVYQHAAEVLRLVTPEPSLSPVARAAEAALAGASGAVVAPVAAAASPATANATDAASAASSSSGAATAHATTVTAGTDAALVQAAARAALQLLLRQIGAGIALPDDLVALAGQVALAARRA